MKLKNLVVRFLTAYGPEEDEIEEKIDKFYSMLECEERSCGLVVEMDCYVKLGKDIIKGDPHEMTCNRKLLWDIMQRRECNVANTMNQCCGVITGSRVKRKVKEESVLDFPIVNRAMVPFVKEMEIESKAKALTRLKKSTPVPSDHGIPVYLRNKCRVDKRKKTRNLLLKERKRSQSI